MPPVTGLELPETRQGRQQDTVSAPVDLDVHGPDLPVEALDLRGQREAALPVRRRLRAYHSMSRNPLSNLPARDHPASLALGLLFRHTPRTAFPTEYAKSGSSRRDS